jgi:hypothetical protein
VVQFPLLPLIRRVLVIPRPLPSNDGRLVD